MQIDIANRQCIPKMQIDMHIDMHVYIQIDMQLYMEIYHLPPEEPQPLLLRMAARVVGPMPSIGNSQPFHTRGRADDSSIECKCSGADQMRTTVAGMYKTNKKKGISVARGTAAAHGKNDMHIEIQICMQIDMQSDMQIDNTHHCCPLLAPSPPQPPCHPKPKGGRV